jgi:DNA-binding MarR family transcriptional regulator
MQSKRAIPGDDEATVMLGLLEAVERDDTVTQRSLAQELDVALGLVNAYLKRCVKKGLIKVQQVPKRRFAYYLTPQGFAEKSRLTASYLSYSFDFFRKARRDCEEVLRGAAGRGWTSLALIGSSDLAEIAIICAVEEGVTIVAIIDPKLKKDQLLGVPVVQETLAAHARAQAVIVTDFANPQESYNRAVAEFGRDRVLVPHLLESAIWRGAVEAVS